MAEHRLEVDNGAYGKDVVSVDLPSNAGPQQKNIPKKVAKPVGSKKRSIFSKLISENVNSDKSIIKDYIFGELIIPTVKDLIYNGAKGVLEIFLFGKDSKADTDRKGYVSYSNYYNKDRRELRRKYASDRLDMDNVVFTTKGEAEQILNILLGILEEYSIVSVADYKDLLDVDGESAWTDNKFGWDNLSSARVRRVANGWLLDLPRPTSID